MKKEHLLSVLFMLGLWQVLAMVVRNDILVPYPHEVVLYLLRLIPQKDTYLAIGTTLWRVCKGFVISFLLALVLALVGDIFPVFARFFEPMNILTKTIPNVSYMILALIWLGAEGAIATVVFMILFPIFYNGFAGRLKNQDPQYIELEALYPETWTQKLKYHTLPLLTREMLTTSKTAISLALKVGVMAEILGSIRVGIGRQLYLAKINLDTSRLFAWTLILICLSLLFDMIFHSITLKDKKEG